MQIHRRSFSGVPLLEVHGDIDHSNSAVFDEAVDAALTDNSRVLLDLTGCPFLDSGGLAVLLMATGRLRSTGWIGTIGASKNLAHLFDVVGLSNDPAFRSFEDTSGIGALLAASSDLAK